MDEDFTREPAEYISFGSLFCALSVISTIKENIFHDNLSVRA